MSRQWDIIIVLKIYLIFEVLNGWLLWDIINFWLWLNDKTIDVYIIEYYTHYDSSL